MKNKYKTKIIHDTNMCLNCSNVNCFIGRMSTVKCFSFSTDQINYLLLYTLCYIICINITKPRESLYVYI